jgi:hypothetical protein
MSDTTILSDEIRSLAADAALAWGEETPIAKRLKAASARIAELEAENAAIRAQLAAAKALRLGRGPVDVDEAWASLPASVTSAAIAAVTEAVGGDAYDCARVWSAWSHGTMGEEDFAPVIGDSDRVAQIAREVTVAVLAAADQALDPDGHPCPVSGWGETP